LVLAKGAEGTKIPAKPGVGIMGEGGGGGRRVYGKLRTKTVARRVKKSVGNGCAGKSSICVVEGGWRRAPVEKRPFFRKGRIRTPFRAASKTNKRRGRGKRGKRRKRLKREKKIKKNTCAAGDGKQRGGL